MPTGRPPFLAIALLSAAALAYEVLLTRLFAIIQWHHFAFMIISLALLGYGASGTFLVLLGESLRKRFPLAFSVNGILFGVSAILCFDLAQRLPFNPLEMAWDWRQLAYLFAGYLLLAVPFFAVANCIGLVLWHYPHHLHRTYGFDLMGAGTGALGVILLLTALWPEQAVLSLGMIGLAAAGLSCRETMARTRCWVLPAFGLPLLLLASSDLQLRLSEYKGLSQALRTSGANLVKETQGPLGAISLVDNEQIPQRHAPGLSLTSRHMPPHQLGLYVDGHQAGAISRFDGDWRKLAYLDDLPAALPYHLQAHPRTLILGMGGGSGVLQALYQGARSVDAVELNPQLVRLVQEEFAEFTGGVYARPDVRIHVAEARGFLAATDRSFDLIDLAGLTARGGATAGLSVLSESYVHTVEAFELYLRRLNPGGMITLSLPLQLPPRGSLKLLATAADALIATGSRSPSKNLALIRSWNTATLIVKRNPLERHEVEALKRFCSDRGFDRVYYPGIDPTEANRYNRLREPQFFEGAQAILGPERTSFLERYKFNLRPATDDRPYFFRFFRWSTLPELLSLQAGGGLAQLEWGYLTLVGTLVQAVLASLLLILLPLYLGQPGKRLRTVSARLRWQTLGYFSLLGIAFLFLEIAFIQKFIQFLSHPLYAIAVVLAAFLIFAGVGSAWSRRLLQVDSGNRLLIWAATAIGSLSLLYSYSLPSLFEDLMILPDPAKILVTGLLIAPLAFAMGLPFPVGLARLSAGAPQLIPWAWAINGCASVISAVLATLLAMEIGFTGVLFLAVLSYLAAIRLLPNSPSPV